MIRLLRSLTRTKNEADFVHAGQPSEARETLPLSGGKTRGLRQMSTTDRQPLVSLHENQTS